MTRGTQNKQKIHRPSLPWHQITQMLRPHESPKLSLILQVVQDDLGWCRFLPEDSQVPLVPVCPIGEHCEGHHCLTSFHHMDPPTIFFRTIRHTLMNNIWTSNA